jgi:ABC-type Fe3+/spermidine/putrescine transport system ATPase subunit
VPHFEIRNLQGQEVRYSAIWQRRNLVLVTLPASDEDGSFRAYVSELTQMAAQQVRGTELVITRDAVAGIPCPGVIIADRWGEIVQVATGSQVAQLPPAHEVVDWVTYVQHQCPECQGEAR